MKQPAQMDRDELLRFVEMVCSDDTGHTLNASLDYQCYTRKGSTYIYSGHQVTKRHAMIALFEKLEAMR